MKLLTLLGIITSAITILVLALILLESRVGEHDILPVVNGQLSETSRAETANVQTSLKIRDADLSSSYKLTTSSPLKINVLLGEKKSRFSYITLIHGIDNTFSYRGFLYNALIMRKNLLNLGSTADFIVMLGFTTLGDTLDYKLFSEDIALLEKAGMRIIYLPRLRAEHRKANFMEMALLKITPWNLTMYDRIQYFDGDILPTKNMDCFFKYEIDTFNTGNASPLNSGWFVSVPNPQIFEEMRKKSLLRLENPWSPKKGWGTEMPDGIFYRGGRKPVTSWDFNGASLDQGLLFDTYALHGTVMLLDNDYATKYTRGKGHEQMDLKGVLKGSNGKTPTQSFVHFTGRNKPWLQDLDTANDRNLVLWKRLLDGLDLPINSSNFRLLGTKPPLGYFAANK